MCWRGQSVSYNGHSLAPADVVVQTENVDFWLQSLKGNETLFLHSSRNKGNTQVAQTRGIMVYFFTPRFTH